MISKLLVDWIKESLPQLDYEKAEDLKLKIDEFNCKKKRHECFSSLNRDNTILKQGDIITDIELFSYNKNYEKGVRDSMAMVISATCDVQNRPNNQFVLLAPVYEEKDYKHSTPEKLASVKKNIIYSKCYLEGNAFKDSLIIDFEMIQPYPLPLVLKYNTKHDNFNKWSLTSFGYYLLVTKLLIFLARAENSKESTRDHGRSKNSFFSLFKSLVKKN